MESKQYLEVILQYKDSQFVATCPAFPRCKGLGETEEEALTKLGRSIGSYIGRMSGRAISSLISSENYTEVVLENDGNPIQKRHFSLDTSLPIQKNLFFKLKSINDLSPTNKPEENDINNLLLIEPDITISERSEPSTSTPTMLPNMPTSQPKKIGRAHV